MWQSNAGPGDKTVPTDRNSPEPRYIHADDKDDRDHERQIELTGDETPTDETVTVPAGGRGEIEATARFGTTDLTARVRTDHEATDTCRLSIEGVLKPTGCFVRLEIPWRDLRVHAEEGSSRVSGTVATPDWSRCPQLPPAHSSPSHSPPTRSTPIIDSPGCSVNTTFTFSSGTSNRSPT